MQPRIVVVFTVILLTALLLISGCAEKEVLPVAKTGDTVKIHYTGTLSDGSTFDTSEGGDPLEFTLGEGTVIPGFEAAVTGMKAGESKTVTIPAAEAYGDYHEEMTLTVGRDRLPPDMSPEVGQQLEMRRDDGASMIVTITKVSDTEVVLDANHPLAGKDLTFALKLVSVN